VIGLRLTISQRLWLGLGLILALFAAAHYVSVRATHSLDAVLSEAVEDSEARSAAAYEMQIALDRMTRAVQSVSDVHEPAQRKQLLEAQEGFERALSSYAAVASTDGSRGLHRDVERRYVRFKEHAAALIQQAGSHARRLAAYDAHQREGDALLRALPRVWAARESPRPHGNAVETALGRYFQVAGALTSEPEVADAWPRIDGARRRVDAALASYEAFARTGAERQWAASVHRWLAQGDRQGRAILAGERAQYRALADLGAQGDALERLLDERIHPAARTELNEAVARASATAHDANLLVTRGLLLALALGVLVAAATTRAVRAPLRALVASSRRVAEGDFSLRVPGGGSDELGKLTVAFNEMAERLQATTVSRSYMESVLDSMGEALLVVSHDGAIETANPAAARLLGYEREQLCGLTFSAVVEGGSERLLEGVQGPLPARFDVRLLARDGSRVPVRLSAVPMREPGAAPAIVCIAQDLRERIAAEERLNYLARHDPLTTLPNRLLLGERLRSALSRAERTGRAVALLYLDLDSFKHVNDTLGHQEGDRLLQAMAARLQGCVRGQDVVARLGGDEFVVIVEDVSEPRAPARVAEKIISVLSAPFELGGIELRMRASVGISLGPAHGNTAEQLLKAADAAMYRAKRTGQGRYEFFSEELTVQAMERLTLENTLRDPRLLEQLVLHYQPQVSIAQARTVGVEALIRWQHPTRGLLGPHHFIPVAEQIGLIHGIGEWVLRTACAQAKAWIDAGHPPMRMAVNISAQQIAGDAIVTHVVSALRETDLDPALLELEVTEGALQTGAEAMEMLGRLKRLGVHLALDDFGTGYSGLSSLKLLPFDRLKIDRAFVRDLETDPSDRALVRAIIAMARSLKLDVLAEGVETEAQLAFLREHRCDEIQGYLVAKPMRAEELRALLPMSAARADLRAVRAGT
jgi:diguanylate cyclase (GGDEF)-like protein/PAS domain S-box-containing protein